MKGLIECREAELMIHRYQSALKNFKSHCVLFLFFVLSLSTIAVPYNAIEGKIFPHWRYHHHIDIILYVFTLVPHIKYYSSIVNISSFFFFHSSFFFITHTIQYIKLKQLSERIWSRHSPCCGAAESSHGYITVTLLHMRMGFKTLLFHVSIHHNTSLTYIYFRCEA